MLSFTKNEKKVVSIKFLLFFGEKDLGVFSVLYLEDR